MTLYSRSAINIRRTWLLITAFLAVIIGFGYLFSQIYQQPIYLIFAVIFSIFWSFISYWNSDKIILAIAGAREVKHDDAPELYHLVENLCLTAGLPIPKIYVVDDPSPNAFATGRDPNHSIICLNRGLLERLEKVELEGVIAHELSHIGNRDILISSVVIVLVGLISILSDWMLRGMFYSRRNDREGGNIILILIGLIAALLTPIIATLIQLAISRKREFLADASGALLTRYPEGLIRALEKIDQDPRPVKRINSAMAHLYITDPLKRRKLSWFNRLWLTHPPIEERIKALKDMAL